ncbi:MAG: hypothetical protein HFG40_03085 [Bacilli bacterium]|nr:hypothetical protein [Bacilli bacterium]
MNNKVLVRLVVPEIDNIYDIYLPINKKIGNIILLLNKAISELSGGDFPLSEFNKLYNATTNTKYDPDLLLANTDIKNGTKLILLI